MKVTKISKTTSQPAQKKKRILWVDIAKAIAILSVLVTHTWPGRTTINIMCISFNMPLLFILSGFTFRAATNWKEFRAHLKKNFLHLVLPSLILILVVDAYYFITKEPSGMTINSPLNLGMQYLFFTGWMAYDGFVPSGWMYWFLIALFMSKLIIDIVNILVPSEKKFYLVTAMGFLGMILAHHGIVLPFCLDISMVAAWFVMLGQFWRQHEALINKISIPLFMVALCFWYWCVTQEFQLDMAGRWYMKGLVSIFEAVAGSFIVCKISQALEDIKFIAKPMVYIGQNTMLIFIIHSLDMYLRPAWGSNVGNEPLPVTFVKKVAVIAATFVFVKLICFIYKQLKSLRKQST